MTSNGFVIIPPKPPAIPAHKKYQKCEFYLSHGLIKVFKFSLAKTTILMNGIFIKTVIGYDLKSPMTPSS